MNQPGPVAANADTDEIRALPRPHCCLCGAKGEPLYEGLRDRLFGAPGQWNLARCPNAECGLLWLDPMPLEEDIGRAYRDYYTQKTRICSEPPRRPVSSGSQADPRIDGA